MGAYHTLKKGKIRRSRAPTQHKYIPDYARTSTTSFKAFQTWQENHILE
jgi:hypothetical protein